MNNKIKDEYKLDKIEYDGIALRNLSVPDSYVAYTYSKNLTVLENIYALWKEMRTLNYFMTTVVELVNAMVEFLNGEGLKAHVTKKLEEWLEDGTLEELINDALFNSKADKIWVEEQIGIINKKLKDTVDNVNEKLLESKEYLDESLENINNEVNEKLQINKDYLDQQVINLNEDINKNTERINDICVSVKDYGALGDGINDDTNAIQTCMNENNCVYFPIGNYLISKPLVIKNFQTIKGAGVGKIAHADLGDASRIIKLGSGTREDLGHHPDFPEMNLGTINAVFMAEKYVGDITISNLSLHGGGGGSAIAIARSYRLRLEQLFITNFYTGIKLLQTWNNEMNTIRIRKVTRGVEIGDEAPNTKYGNPQSTSTNLNNVFVEDAQLGFIFTNLTYSSANSISTDFISECAYWFQYTTMGINGLGNEFSVGQLIRCWRSNISVNGLMVLNSMNYPQANNKPYHAKSYAKIEVWSENRAGTGLSINGGEIRNFDENSSGYADKYSITGSSGLTLINFRESDWNKMRFKSLQSAGYLRDGVGILDVEKANNTLTQIKNDGVWSNFGKL